MPFSDELRKCKWCGQHEMWGHFVWKDGQAYCQSCYIKKFSGKEDLKSGKIEENKMSV